MHPDPVEAPAEQGITVSKSSGPCQSEGCQGTREFAPVLILRHKRTPNHAVRQILTVGICTAHKAHADVDDFVTNETWNITLSAFDHAKRARPTRSLTAVDFVPYESEEAIRSRRGL